MLRKSPYVEENYNYLTSMMESMKLQENLFNQQTCLDGPSHNTLFNQPNSIFSTNSNMNSNQLFNARDIDSKKKIQTDTSVYDKTLSLLKNGAMMDYSNSNIAGNLFQNPQQNFFSNTNNTMNYVEHKIAKCFGCLKEKSQNSMQVEDKFDSSQFSDCAYCHSSSCMECTRKCDVCWRLFCKICVNIRYEEYMDKIVCIYCLPQ